MFTGLTRQEQRTLLLLIAVAVSGAAIQQWHGAKRSSQALVIDARSGQVITDHLPDPSRPSSAAPSASSPSAPNAESSRLVDLNTATVTELLSLPGIGEIRARDIIAYRQANGPFRSVDGLDAVPGVGSGTLARLRPHVAVSGVPASPPVAAPVVAMAPIEPVPVVAPTPLTSPPPSVAQLSVVNVNTAGQEELMLLPGVGEVIARRIIDYRTSHGPFRRAEDLLNVERIGPRTLERLRPLITF